ncbi:hypothetical protein JTE90_008301 [Oedothorax gibbosus]|uniref:Fe2OG dioxygenase domain-containing protein n=1 Tax=Oedothorax gibbosus TaxID=931172 RepID=A0AAV6UIB0_9ARAC|nr:hypothetical protein JTE90_008301 [Oedothorax gibbosus]
MSLQTDLNIENIPNFYDADYSQQVLTELLSYKYQDLKLRFHDKEFIPRRKVLAFGDPGLVYTFSGTNVPANRWPDTLLNIKKDVEARTGEEYNYVLLNYYSNGLSKIGSHKDDVTSLDPASTIPTLSFGATRTIHFTRKGSPSNQVQLLNGSLLLMKAPINKFWNHEIPAEPDVTSPRVSLTFKKIKTSRKRTFDDCFSSSSECSPKPTTSRRVSCEPIPENDWLTQLYIDLNPSDQPTHSKSNITIKEWNLGYGLIKLQMQKMHPI